MTGERRAEQVLAVERFPDRVTPVSLAWTAILAGVFLLAPRPLCWLVAVRGWTRTRAAGLYAGIVAALCLLAMGRLIGGGSAVALGLVLAIATPIGMHMTRSDAPAGYPMKWFAPALLRLARPAVGFVIGFALSQAMYEAPLIQRQQIPLDALPTWLWITYLVAPAHFFASWADALFATGLGRAALSTMLLIAPLVETALPGCIGARLVARPDATESTRVVVAVLIIGVAGAVAAVALPPSALPFVLRQLFERCARYLGVPILIALALVALTRRAARDRSPVG